MNQRPLSAKQKNNIKKVEKKSYTGNKALINYWNEKNKKSEEKEEKIRKEIYDKQYSEMRETPKIDLNSKKIVKKILRNKPSENINNSEIKSINSVRSYSNHKVCLTDYSNIFSNRNKDEYNLRPHTLRKVNRNLNNKIKIKTTKPIIKNEKNINHFGYLKYDPVKVNEVRHKVHEIFDSKCKNNTNQQISDSYYNYINKTPYNVKSNNNDNQIHSLIELNYNNEKVNPNINYLKEKTEQNKNIDNHQENISNINEEKKINDKLEEINNNDNENKNEKLTEHNLNTEMEKEENIKNINSETQIINKPIEVPKVEVLNNKNNPRIENEEIKKINNDQNENNRTLNKRSNDLKKFILFANNLNFPLNISKPEESRNIAKFFYQKPNSNNENQFLNFELNNKKFLKINDNNIYPKIRPKPKYQ